MVKCFNCGTENEIDAIFCAGCGKKLNSNEMGWETKLVAVVIIVVFGIFGSVIYLSLGFGIPDPFSLVNQDNFYLPTVSGENVFAYKSSCIESIKHIYLYCRWIIAH